MSGCPGYILGYLILPLGTALRLSDMSQDTWDPRDLKGHLVAVLTSLSYADIAHSIQYPCSPCEYRQLPNTERRP